MKTRLRIIITAGFLIGGITAIFAQDNPTSFSSEAMSPSQVDLSFAPNGSSDDILIAVSTDGTFGTPTGVYSVGNSISGGGTVIYFNNGTSYSHIALSANTNYYYKAWSFDNVTYSTGLTSNALTYKWEPTYHPTAFATGTPTANSIALNWVDAVGYITPEAYLIKASTIGFADITNPTDGVAETPSTLIHIANYGDQTVNFNSLNGNTTYYFKIYGYTNSGNHIDYKLDPVILTASATTAPTPVSIVLSDDIINEGAESGELITVTIDFDDFVSSLTPANWTLNNLPNGVTKGTITRTGNQTATIALVGNRTSDYDVNITNLEVVINGAEFVNIHNSASVNSGVIFIATDDAESIAITSDGTINEGSENGEVISVTLSGGTFTSGSSLSSFTVSNLPSGVSAAATMTVLTSTTATFVLSGNATADYDNDITNLTVAIDDSEIDDHTGADISTNSGVTFTATDDAESLSIASDGNISEASENGEDITVSLTGGSFAPSLSASNWSLGNLPSGISLSVVRDNATQATITLSGNRLQDYDADILSTLTVTAAEIDDVSTDLSSSNSITFSAIADAEAISMANDVNGITEANENSEVITVSLTGGTFASSITPANWALTNLPVGVSVGSVVKSNATTVLITLSGNRTIDYETNITNATLTINQDEIDDYASGDFVINTGIVFTGNPAGESITLSWATSPGTNGAEATLNSDVLTAYISEGTFVSAEINTANITATGDATTSAGVSIESVAFVDATHISIALAWDNTDFDANQDLIILISGDAYDDGTSPLAKTITLLATIEPVAITLSDNTINESAEDGELINVSIANDLFVGVLTETNWVLNNLPNGVTKGTITRTGNQTATIALVGNRTSDYDVNITNLEVVIDGTEFVNIHNSASANSGVIFIATDDAESIAITSDGTINEGSEDGEVISVTLSGGTFTNGSSISSFTVSNLPPGVSAAATMTVLTSTTATFTLSGNATADYDNDITNLTVAIDDSEIDDHTGADISANSGVTFIATDDAESLSIASDGNISEASENGEAITVSLTGGSFAPSLSSGNWALSNLPSGISLSVVRDNATQATITLSGNRLQDYDADILSTLTVAAAEIDDVSTDLSSSNSITFSAIADAEAISMANDVNGITEANENSEVITVSLTGGTFASSITPANWALTNLPVGVSVGSVVKSNATTVLITLSGNRTIDYETNITNATLTINQNEIDDYASGDFVINTGIVFTGENDAESIALSWASAPGTNGLEPTLDAEILEVVLTGGTFVLGQITTTNITASGDATTSAGVSIESVAFVDATHITIALAWDNTDFDVDKNLIINVFDAAYDVGTSTLMNYILLTATDEPVSIVMSDDGINESAENGEIITVNIDQDEFIASINSSNWTLNNLPTGVTKGTITRTGNKTASIALVGNRTIDYDADITNLELEIDGAEFITHTSVSATANSGVTFIANSDIETLAISGSANEANESAQTVVVTLTGGTWASSLNSTNWSLNNAPTGVSVGGVSIDGGDPTKVNLLLSGNRTTDYDVNITNMTVTVQSSELADVPSGSVSSAIGFTFNATSESVSISSIPSPITELNLNTPVVITLSLTNETFVDATIDKANFILNNAPNGITILSSNYSNATTATITLTYDETDFDSDYNNFNVSINGLEINSGASITSNDLTITADGTEASEAIDVSWATSPGTNGVEATMNAENLTIALINGTFNQNEINTTNITASGTAVTNGGVSIESVTYIDPATINISIAWNGTDYDSDLNLEINISNIAYSDGATTLVDNINLPATNETVSVSVTNLSYFGNVEVGSSSSEQSFTVSGTNLLGNIILNPPSNFEISTSTGGSFSATNPITLTPTGGTVSTTTIYVRFAPTSTGSKNGNITITSTGVSNQSVSVSGFGVSAGASGSIAITEVADYYSDSNCDYIEVFNDGDAAIDLSGWTIEQRYESGTASNIFTFSTGNQRNTGGSNYMILEPGEFAVIVYQDYNKLISNHSIDANIAVFSSISLPIINGDDRFQVNSNAKAIIDTYGDWDDAGIFSSEPSKSYERNSTTSDGELETSWTVSSSQSYGYTPGSFNNNPLPIDLIDFIIAEKDDNLILNWTTASEFNSDYFIIERSFDAKTFSSIGIQTAAGFSNNQINYSFSIANETNVMHYFRLVCFDYDGSYIYSNTLSHFSISNFEIGQPWVANQQIYIPISGVENGDIQIEIYDSKGGIIQKEFLQKGVSENIIKINKSANMTTGVYYLRLIINGKILTDKFYCE